jgi:predicted esterase
METCKHSLTALQDAGYQVAWYEYPMGHSVSMQEIDDIRAFLLNMTT